MKARSVGTFVQIGNLAINLALVEEIEFLEDTVRYYKRKGSTPITLRGEKHTAFLDWWERQAVQSEPQFVYTGGNEDASWPPVLCSQAKK